MVKSVTGKIEGVYIHIAEASKQTENAACGQVFKSPTSCKCKYVS